jgi:hypothetical protein|eukprot:301588-Prymnesium_polylepis.1
MASPTDMPSGPVIIEQERNNGLMKGLLSALPEAEAQGTNVRVALVLMTKRPMSLGTWLAYHREKLGVKRFYIRVEDTPELEALFRTPPWDTLVVATFATGGVRDYFEQTNRQDAHVTSSIPLARAAGCTHILHIDDDELCYLPSGLRALHVALSNVRPRIREAHVSRLDVSHPPLDLRDSATVTRLALLAGRCGTWRR